jgi:hypothetical protein
MNTYRDFLTVEDHFNALLGCLNEDDRSTYDSFRNVRVETGFRDRDFVIYRVWPGNDVEVLDTLTVLSFQCEDEFGASAEIESDKHARAVRIDYTPVRPFDYPFFMWLPLHSRIRWAAQENNIEAGSLAFPIVIRTASRRHLREPSIVYCETYTSFVAEFPNALELI